jgi:superfamily II DNA or RNA helicase
MLNAITAIFSKNSNIIFLYRQTIGRILRTSQVKTEAVIFDYVDKAGILQNSFKSRQAVYESIGIDVC